MPFNVSEEQSLLASMISERDAQISSLTNQLHSTSEVLHTTQKELQQKSASRRAQREDHSATIKKLKEEHSEQRRVLAKYEQNVKNGGGLRVHEYAALMRSANSSQVESSYVIRLQAQLCRAMHSLGVMESQLALVKENCSSLIRFMKEDLSHMVDDRTRREIELMNGLARADGEKRVMAEEMDQKIREKEELLDQVRDEYEELGLEYDEREVKRALEVKYLLEQMERVGEDKVRLEKELLAALLEREERINKLRVENEELGGKLEGLKKEAERRDVRGRGGGDLGRVGSNDNISDDEDGESSGEGETSEEDDDAGEGASSGSRSEDEEGEGAEGIGMSDSTEIIDEEIVQEGERGAPVATESADDDKTQKGETVDPGPAVRGAAELKPAEEPVLAEEPAEQKLQEHSEATEKAKQTEKPASAKDSIQPKPEEHSEVTDQGNNMENSSDVSVPINEVGKGTEDLEPDGPSEEDGHQGEGVHQRDSRTIAGDTEPPKSNTPNAVQEE